MNQDQQKEFEKLHSDLKVYLNRIPGYGQIILIVLTMPMDKRIESLKIMLGWLKRYPNMKFSGMKSFSENNYSLVTDYKCEDCNRNVQESVTLFLTGEIHPLDETPEMSQKKPHLVCANCYERDHYEPDYEPEPPEPSENFDSRVVELMNEGLNPEEANKIATQEFKDREQEHDP